MGALERLAVFAAVVRLKHAQARERDDPRTLPSHSSAIPAANLSGKGNEELGQPVIRPGLPQGLPVWPDRRRDFSCSPNYGGLKAPVDSAPDTPEDAPANSLPSRRPLHSTLPPSGAAGPPRHTRPRRSRARPPP